MKNRVAFALNIWVACLCLALFPAAAQQLPTTQTPAPPAPANPQPPAIVDEETAATATPKPTHTNVSTEHGQVNLGDPELEPQVTIVQKDGERHEEVRVNGQLRYVRVVPTFGPVYFLVPLPNGQMARRNDIDPSLSPPMWQLFSW